MQYLISLFEWGEEKLISSEIPLKKGDEVIVDLGFGKHLGTVLRVIEECDKKCGKCDKYSTSEDYVIMRKATSLEREKVKLGAHKKKEMITKCRVLVKKYELPMKLTGVDVSLEGGGIIFGFTAEERIDFRSLVRELASTFQKSVRLQQMGSRDEARKKGGLGPCGRPFCCLSETIPIKSIGTDMARLQQISHRGNERLSGCCNRLMCCLAFEQETYEIMRKNLPDIGSTVMTKNGAGTVENLKILSQEVEVRSNENRKETFWINIKEIVK